MAFVRLSAMPSPPTLRCANVQAPSGGLNIKDVSWRVAANQSPEMKNMWWEEGALRSRPEQMIYNNGMTKDIGDTTELDVPTAAYPKPYHGWYVMACGRAFFAVSEDLSVHMHIEAPRPQALVSQAGAGTFFVYNDVLYYKAKGVFKYFELTDELAENGLRRLQVRDVEPFVPTILINGDPAVAGSGDLYQPANRFTRTRIARFSATAETKEIRLPEPAEHYTVEYFDEDGDIRYLPVETAIKENGVIVGISAPEGIPNIDAARMNNVRVWYDVVDDTGFYDTILDCDVAAVYGTGQAQCIVLAGCSTQRNAYFWSSNTDVGMNAGYFPVEHYNLAGDAGNPITAFGKQQNMLVIFQEDSVGRCVFDTEEVDGRTFITMHHEVINPNIGCDLPRSVQLVENNLVFAHTQRGVLLIRDTTSAHENNIVKVSTNIEAPVDVRGLLYDLRRDQGNVCSIDDGKRYWLYANGHTWLWDYSLGASFTDPGRNAWFYFDGISPGAWFGYENGLPTYIGRDGYLHRFSTNAADSTYATGEWKTKGEDFERLLTLHTLDFGTYEVLKNVEKAIFVTQGSGNATIQVEYETDYGIRLDPTPLVTRGWSLVPRDLSFRSLYIAPFAVTAVRKPNCRHVRHFLARLSNRERGAKVTFISAQIYYTFQGVDR